MADYFDNNLFETIKISFWQMGLINAVLYS